MNTSEILTSIQTQLITSWGSEDINEPTTFYNDLISEMPSSGNISSFLIGVNTNPVNKDGLGIRPESNLTIITFDDGGFDQADIELYLQHNLNDGHDYTEWTWLNNILIIAFEF